MIGWIKKIHEIMYREEQPVSYILPHPPTPGSTASEKAQKANDDYAKQQRAALIKTVAQSYQQHYQQYAGQQAYIACTAPNISLSAISNPIWAQTGTGSLNGNFQSIGQMPAMPHPTGNHFTISFRDANGVSHHMVIDQAYIPIMQQISQMQQCYVPQGPLRWPVSSPPPPTKMVDGEFSLDEMGQAEEIIMELDGAH